MYLHVEKDSADLWLENGVWGQIGSVIQNSLFCETIPLFVHYQKLHNTKQILYNVEIVGDRVQFADWSQ